MRYQIVGCEHMVGKSKQTGKPYDMDILHVICQTPPRGDAVGNTVDKIPISRASGLLVRTPQPGEMYEIYYDRRGFVEYADLVK